MHFPFALTLVSALMGVALPSPVPDPEDSEGRAVQVIGDSPGNITYMDLPKSGLEKRSYETRGYIWTTDCTGEHFTWDGGNGCYAYIKNGQVQDMYSFFTQGEKLFCYYTLYDNQYCSGDGGQARQFAAGYDTCIHNIGYTKAFKSISIYC